MFGRSSKPIRVQVFARTDLGKTREHNEDCFLVADLTRGERSAERVPRQHELGERGSLLVVADGMGGAAAGEIASVMATDTIFEQMRKMWGAEKEATAQRFAYRLKEAVEVANTHIHTYAKAHPEVRGMGTTTTAAGTDLAGAAERLIALANERGGPDNITVIIARFDGEGLRPPDGGDDVGHQVYPLIDTETSTEPVPVYRGSPAPVSTKQVRWRVIAAALLGAAIVAAVLYLAARNQ